MRIAVVSTSYPRSDGDPSGHFVRAEVRALEREGHDVRVIAPPSGGAFGWPGVAARVRERPLRALEAARWVASARRLLARRDPGGAIDRVVAHWAVPCAWPIAIAAPAELDVVSHGGDVRLLARAPAPLRGAVVRAIATRARTWRFVSESLRDELIAVLSKDDAARVRAIACVEAAAIELPDVDALRALGQARRRGFGAAPLAVSVGRLVPDKRVDAAIVHAATLGAKIVVVGDGPERARLEAHAASLGVDARFVGVVARHEALAWIAAADVVIHASRREGLSTVVREARAIGTPLAWIRS